MSQESSSGSLKDAIITLPLWGIVMLSLLCGGSLILAAWLAVTAQNDGIKGTAVQLLVILVPLTSAVIASIAIRRTSTAQIDKLINGFLEKTLLQRFSIWCKSTVPIFTAHGYPFARVSLREPVRGQSYAFYNLGWRNAELADALVGIKTNVFNFEIFTTLAVQLPAESNIKLKSESWIVTPENVSDIQDHPLLYSFFSLIQGSVNEGYMVALDFTPEPNNSNPCSGNLFISLRQKMRENFLTSSFLKRYFAEDAAIAVGVLFSEYQQSGLMPATPQ
jgi:hypothetical protein